MTTFKAKLRKNIEDRGILSEEFSNFATDNEPNSWLIHLKMCYLNYLLLVKFSQNSLIDSKIRAYNTYIGRI